VTFNRPKLLLLAISLLFATASFAQDPTFTVRILDKPDGLVHGNLPVRVAGNVNVTRIELYVNGVKHSELQGTSGTLPVVIGDYIRRLRFRAVGYDAQNQVVGEDEMVVNDPQPPFRVRLQAPATLPATGNVSLTANVIKPNALRVTGVDFYVGESKVGAATNAPYGVSFDAAAFPSPVYARVVAHSNSGEEANDVVFFGTRARAEVDVSLHQIPLSVASGGTPLTAAELSLIDEGKARRIESLVPASDQPLNVVMLIDGSESMLEELPVVKQAAKQFAQTLLRPGDRVAVVMFNQRSYWLTNFTSDANAVAAAVDRIQPRGETHLYDSAIEMLYELQKQPGRRALVILTDGVDQGSSFKLDHLVHYARYAGVPIYPILKNKLLSRMVRFGIGLVQVRKVANLAKETGATYFIIQSERELPAIYARIAQELRQQYLLLFYSDPAASDTWHSLAVFSSNRDRVFRVPRGYFP
jgi:Ca-activated chloride channel family protein